MSTSGGRPPGSLLGPTRGPVLGMVLPGYISPTDAYWTGTGAGTVTADIDAIKALGFTWVALMTEYSSATWAATDVTTTASGSAVGALSDAAVTNVISYAKSVGMKVCLKPHLVMADGSVQSQHVPGCQMSRALGTGASQDGTYTSGAATFSATQLSLVNSATPTGNVGDRIVTPGVGHQTEIPQSGYQDPYGRSPDPTWTTIATVTSSTAGTMSANAGASSSTGLLYVLHDADAATCMSNWLAVLEHLLSLGAAAGGVDMIDVATEKDWWMRYYRAAWAATCDTLKGLYPNLLLVAQTSEAIQTAATSYGGYYCADIPFADHLHLLGCSAYPSVGDTGTPNEAPGLIFNKWVSASQGLEGWARAWGKPVLLCEVGARSIASAYYEPYVTSGGTSQRPAQDQGNFLAGCLDSVVSEPWCAGFMWWNWYGKSGTSETTSYAPQQVAENVFSVRATALAATLKGVNYP